MLVISPSHLSQHKELFNLFNQCSLDQADGDMLTCVVIDKGGHEMSFVKVSLEGKVALVTGGSRGIGRAIALNFADAGANVVISSRKLPELEAVSGELKAKGRRSLAIASHIAKPEDSKNLVQKIQAEFGRIDILVNNAGTNPYVGPLFKAEEWAWDATMNVNLKGPFILGQMVARMMKEQGGGSIINIASVAGLRASALNIYSVTKAGVIMLTKVMAKEWGRYGIRVNAIAPGIIKTKLSETLWKDPVKGEKAAHATSLGRIGVPEEIADVALFLASDASRYVTGDTIIVDGGELLGGSEYPE
jgi:NAD(P)-dependent dehydrogenase (short-subunit alcohol dehydrogenase family)